MKLDSVFHKNKRKANENEKDSTDISIGNNLNVQPLLGFLIYVDPNEYTTEIYRAILRMISSLGGKVLDSPRKGMTCVILESAQNQLYLDIIQKFSDMTFVSWKWLKGCYKERKLLNYDEYRIKSFTKCGYVISCTGIDISKRIKLAEIIHEQGAEFCDQLEKGKTTHLICEKPEGAKYEAAKKWGIVIVKTNWIYECIKSKCKYCLHPLTFYYVHLL